MTRTPFILAELLADCEAHGIRLVLAGEGGLTIDAPHDALTSDLLARLRDHKAELLALLWPMPPERPKPVCRCGSTTWRDVPVHRGQSVRRDCGRCERFLNFPVWYGNDTGQQSQYSLQSQHGKTTINKTE